MRSIRKYILSSVNNIENILVHSVNGCEFISVGVMHAEFISILTQRTHKLYLDWSGHLQHHFRNNNGLRWQFSSTYMIIQRRSSEKPDMCITYTFVDYTKSFLNFVKI